MVFPFYHVVSGDPLPHVRHLYRQLDPEGFIRDLEGMAAVFQPVSLTEYLASLSPGGRAEGRRRRMVLTFDDGLAQCHTVIAPILREKGIPATFFLNNRFLDEGGMFYRFKASILADTVLNDPSAAGPASGFLGIQQDQLYRAILMIGGQQEVLLNSLAREMGVDFEAYQNHRPVYLQSGQVSELMDWGFDVGGHSDDHTDFRELDPEQMKAGVKESLRDLRKRFGAGVRTFSFPFTSDGVPRHVIESLLEGEEVAALLGTAGLKRTGNPRFIQRIPMEEYRAPAVAALKAEYLYYLLKFPAGRNRLRY